MSTEWEGHLHLSLSHQSAPPRVTRSKSRQFDRAHGQCLASFVRAGRAAGSRCQNWKISGTGGNVAASASSQGTQTEPSGGGAVGVTEHQAE